MCQMNVLEAKLFSIGVVKRRKKITKKCSNLYQLFFESASTIKITAV